MGRVLECGDYTEIGTEMCEQQWKRQEIVWLDYTLR